MGAMSRIIDEPLRRKILKKSLINSILYQIGYKFGFGLDDGKLCHDRSTYWVDHVQDISECESDSEVLTQKSGLLKHIQS